MATTKESKVPLKKRFSPFTLITLTIFLLICCLAVWYAMEVFLLAFAAILFAILLTTISTWISRNCRLPYAFVLTCVILGLIGGLTLLFWLSAPLIGEQLKTLLEVVPAGYAALKAKASTFIDFEALSRQKLASEFLLNNDKIIKQATALFSFTVGTVTSILIFFLVGVYLSYSPERYVNGFLSIFSTNKKKRIEKIFNRLAHSLRWWLLGKIIAMAIVGILTGIGLWILHIPLAFILGLLAGLLTFIPYVGPILSSIPAILIGLTISPLKALYIVLLYLLIHAIEGYFVTPYIDQKTVFLPPALTILAQLLFIVLIGFLGLVLASPLTVVVIILLQELYIKPSEVMSNRIL